MLEHGSTNQSKYTLLDQLGCSWESWDSQRGKRKIGREEPLPLSHNPVSAASNDESIVILHFQQLQESCQKPTHSETDKRRCPLR